MAEFKSKFDFGNVDISKVDPDRLDLGTGQQDCMLIASAFERGAHSTPTEAAVFATLTRTVQNNKQLAGTLVQNLNSYIQSPSQTTSQAAEFASAAVPDTGTSSQTEHNLQSLNIGTQNSATLTNDFGQKLLEWARDCIPCGFRLASFLELHPNIDLLDILDDYLEQQLSALSDITGLLNNFSSYNDFCKLLNLLSFMCIPDLQRIIALLMALFTLKVPKLDGLIGVLQALITPIFAPLLMALSSLLDQFVNLVVSPLDCVSAALKAQIKKLNIETPFVSVSVTSSDPFEKFSDGLEQLDEQLQEGIQEIRNKMNFYLSQVKAMLSELGGGDTAYLQAKLDILKLIRMIAFIVAIISALSKGHAACSSDGTAATPKDIDSFFDNFLNPNSAFNMWVGEDGQIHIDEKDDDFTQATNPPNQSAPLPQVGNVFQFEGESLLDESTATQVTTIGTALITPIRTTVPCKLETSVEDLQKVNQWIAELNSL